MGSAHILVLGFLGAHNPYTPTRDLFGKNDREIFALARENFR